MTDLIKTREDYREEDAVAKLEKHLAECGVLGFVLLTVKPSRDGVGLNIRTRKRNVPPDVLMQVFYQQLGEAQAAVGATLQQLQQKLAATDEAPKIEIAS